MRNIIFSWIFLLLWVCVLTLPIVEESSDKQTEKTNDAAESLIDRIIDLAIRNIKKKAAGPIKLEDEIKQFKRKILAIPINGEIILYNGQLWGIDTISRCGDATFDVKDGRIDINTTFRFENLTFIYDFQANIFKLSTDGIVGGNMTKLVADVGLQIDIKEKIIELTRLRLLKAKSLRIQIDSTKMMDKVINFVLKSATTLFKTAILTQIEKELQGYLGYTIHFSAKNIS